MSATQLTLRSAPVVADRTRVGVLNQGKEVQVLGPAGEPGWVRIRVSLSGLLREGVVAERYLKALPPSRGAASVPATPAQAAALPAAHMQPDRADITRRRDGGRAYPLGEAGRPARAGGDAASLAASVSAIVDYLDVANPAHLRYRPAGGTTYCNIYATDLAYLCGVYLPRVWWTDRALLQLREGAQVAVEYGRTVRELNANSLYDWLEDFGPAFGWRREVELTALQAAANAGQVCVIVARRVDLNRPGHITAVVPETRRSLGGTQCAARGAASARVAGRHAQRAARTGSERVVAEQPLPGARLLATSVRRRTDGRIGAFGHPPH